MFLTVIMQWFASHRRRKRDLKRFWFHWNFHQIVLMYQIWMISSISPIHLPPARKREDFNHLIVSRVCIILECKRTTFTVKKMGEKVKGFFYHKVTKLTVRLKREDETKQAWSQQRNHWRVFTSGEKNFSFWHTTLAFLNVSLPVIHFIAFLLVFFWLELDV